MAVMLQGGEVLVVGGSVAAHEDCCCTQENCHWYDLYNAFPCDGPGAAEAGCSSFQGPDGGPFDNNGITRWPTVFVNLQDFEGLRARVALFNHLAEADVVPGAYANAREDTNLAWSIIPSEAGVNLQHTKIIVPHDQPSGEMLWSWELRLIPNGPSYDVIDYVTAYNAVARTQLFTRALQETDPQYPIRYYGIDGSYTSGVSPDEAGVANSDVQVAVGQTPVYAWTARRLSIASGELNYSFTSTNKDVACVAARDWPHLSMIRYSVTGTFPDPITYTPTHIDVGEIVFTGAGSLSVEYSYALPAGDNSDVVAFFDHTPSGWVLAAAWHDNVGPDDEYDYHELLVINEVEVFHRSTHIPGSAPSPAFLQGAFVAQTSGNVLVNRATYDEAEGEFIDWRIECYDSSGVELWTLEPNAEPALTPYPYSFGEMAFAWNSSDRWIYVTCFKRPSEMPGPIFTWARSEHEAEEHWPFYLISHDGSESLPMGWIMAPGEMIDFPPVAVWQAHPVIRAVGLGGGQGVSDAVKNSAAVGNSLPATSAAFLGDGTCEDGDDVTCAERAQIEAHWDCLADPPDFDWTLLSPADCGCTAELVSHVANVACFEITCSLDSSTRELCVSTPTCDECEDCIDGASLEVSICGFPVGCEFTFTDGGSNYRCQVHQSTISAVMNDLYQFFDGYRGWFIDLGIAGQCNDRGLLFMTRTRYDNSNPGNCVQVVKYYLRRLQFDVSCVLIGIPQYFYRVHGSFQAFEVASAPEGLALTEPCLQADDGCLALGLDGFVGGSLNIDFTYSWNDDDGFTTEVNRKIICEGASLGVDCTVGGVNCRTENVTTGLAGSCGPYNLTFCWRVLK